MTPAQAQARMASRWLVTVAAMLATIIEVLDVTIANVALPHMQASFSSSVDEITWVLTSYLVANGIVMPLTGWLSARFGRKRFFVGSTVLFTASSMLCGMAWNLESMVVFRILQGIGGAALIPLSQASLMEAFPASQQGMAMAIWGVGLMSAPVMGPMLGGWLTDNYHWRWIFFVNLPFGGLAALLQMLFIHDSTHERKAPTRIDGVGLALVVLSVGCLQLMLDRGERADWFTSPWITGLAATSALSFVALAGWEVRHPEPVADLRLFRYRTFAVASALQAILAFALYGNVLTFPLYLQSLSGYSALQAGMANAPRGVATMVGMFVVAAAYGRIDTRIILGVGFALVTIGGFQMAHYTPAWGFWEFVQPSLVHGLGMGFTFVPLSAAALAAVPPARMENASGLFNLMRNAGGSIGISVCGTLIVRRAQLHQAHLVDHVTAANPTAALALADAGRLGQAAGLDAASAAERAPALLYAFIQREAANLAFEDAFRFLAWLSLAMLPLLFVIGKIKGEMRAAH
jgi:MFS transporter, DHA2 family, multidrug resistance protein